MIRVVVVDDEALVRDALVAVLSMQPDVEIIGEAGHSDEAITLISALKPDIAVLDLQLPGADGVEVAIKVAEQSPHTRCLIVTSHARPGYLKRALANGVRGFLPKTTSARVLADVIRRVQSGERYVDPVLSAEAIAAGDSPLTPREADVLEIAAGGAPVEEIAVRAHLSAGTVRNYLSAAATKLGAANRHEAVMIARRRGWI